MDARAAHARVVSELIAALSVKYLISLDLTTPPECLCSSVVHHGPRRVSGCCHGGGLSSSLTSAPLSSASGTTIYIPAVRDSATTENVHRATSGSGGTTASPVAFVSAFARLYRVVSQNLSSHGEKLCQGLTIRQVVGPVFNLSR